MARRRGTPAWSLRPETVPTVDELLPTLAGLTNSRIYKRNAVEVIINGYIFDAILRDIDNASNTIHIETFVWCEGELEQRIKDALLAATSRGVIVRLIVDGVGSRGRTSGIFDELREGGVQLHVFSPLSLFSIHRFNERTHRKLVIVDGRIGYTMGHGISDHWLGNASDENHYRDTGIRMRGAVVQGLQSVFASGWARNTAELLCGELIFPPQDEPGDVTLCVVGSTAGEDYSSVALAFTLAVASARQEILIQNPYFAPDQNVVGNLCKAARRGVSVTLMLPGRKTDSNMLRLAAKHLYPQLLEAGVTVLEYTPTLNHQKVMIVDGCLARVGSTNLDCRSLELNAEAGVIFHDANIAATLRKQFLADAQHCTPITNDVLDKRWWGQRIRSAGAYLIHGQL